MRGGQAGKLYHLVTFSFTKRKVCYQHLERKVSKSWSLDAKINFIKFPQAQIQPATNPIWFHLEENHRHIWPYQPFHTRQVLPNFSLVHRVSQICTVMTGSKIDVIDLSHLYIICNSQGKEELQYKCKGEKERLQCIWKYRGRKEQIHYK